MRTQHGVSASQGKDTPQGLIPLPAGLPASRLWETVSVVLPSWSGVLSRFPWEVVLSVNQKPATPITSYSYNLINIAPPAEMGGRLMSSATEQCPPVLWDKSKLWTPASRGQLKAMGHAGYTEPSLQRVLTKREMVVVKRKTCGQGLVNTMVTLAF